MLYRYSWTYVFLRGFYVALYEIGYRTFRLVGLIFEGGLTCDVGVVVFDCIDFISWYVVDLWVGFINRGTQGLGKLVYGGLFVTSFVDWGVERFGIFSIFAFGLGAICRGLGVEQYVCNVYFTSVKVGFDLTGLVTLGAMFPNFIELFGMGDRWSFVTNFCVVDLVGSIGFFDEQGHVRLFAIWRLVGHIVGLYTVFVGQGVGTGVFVGLVGVTFFGVFLGGSIGVTYKLYNFMGTWGQVRCGRTSGRRRWGCYGCERVGFVGREFVFRFCSSIAVGRINGQHNIMGTLCLFAEPYF